MVSKHDMFLIFLIYSCYMVGHMLGLVITNGRSIGYLDHVMEISHQSHLSLSSGQVILHVGQVCSSSSCTGYPRWGIAKVEMKKWSHVPPSHLWSYFMKVCLLNLNPILLIYTQTERRDTEDTYIQYQPEIVNVALKSFSLQRSLGIFFIVSNLI